MPFLAHFPPREEQQLTWARSPAHTHTHPRAGAQHRATSSTCTEHCAAPRSDGTRTPPTDIPATVSSAQVLPRALGFIWDVGDVFNGLL